MRSALFVSRLALACLLAGAVLPACGGTTPEPTASKPEGTAKKGEGKKKKAAAAAEGEEGEAAKEGEAGPPVLRTARFRVPLKDLQDADALRAVVVAAWEKSAKAEGVTPPAADEKAKPWKCRRVTAWETKGAEGVQLRLFERLDTPDCKKADAKEEQWELTLRYQTPARPDKKDQGGTLKYLMASEDHDWLTAAEGSAWKTTYGSVYRVEGEKEGEGFSHDDAWISGELPGGLKIGKKAEVAGWRWSLGQFEVAGEKVTVEAERWDCGDGKVAGAELVFRTNKRQAGHTTANPKDVVVTDKFQAFADAVTKELGDKVGGKGTVVEAGLTCAP
jgi:hypothetical protein